MDTGNKLQPKILLVTADLSSARYIADILASNNFCVKTTSYINQAMDLLKKENYDLCIVDVSLSDGSGYYLCTSVKDIHSIPVIFVSAVSDENHIVSAFDSGAEDFITIPFRKREFLSRINRVITHSNKMAPVISFKNIRVDTVKGLVTKDDKEIFLSALEYRMLLLFLANKGKILSRQMLLDEVWSLDGHYISDNTLTVYIKRIREKLEDNPTAPKLIKTVRGKGYKTGE